MQQRIAVWYNERGDRRRSRTRTSVATSIKSRTCDGTNRHRRRWFHGHDATLNPAMLRKSQEITQKTGAAWAFFVFVIQYRHNEWHKEFRQIRGEARPQIANCDSPE